MDRPEVFSGVLRNARDVISGLLTDYILGLPQYVKVGCFRDKKGPLNVKSSSRATCQLSWRSGLVQLATGCQGLRFGSKEKELYVLRVNSFTFYITITEYKFMCTEIYRHFHC